jgi:hypothetical protein
MAKIWILKAKVYTLQAKLKATDSKFRFQTEAEEAQWPQKIKQPDYVYD